MLALALAAMLVQQPLPPTRSDRPIQDTSLFRRLELPAPNRIRTGAGAPGPDYWQQKVDYTIAVTLDPATHRISGSETVTYHNNSPDTLRYLWFQLDQNICRPDARGAFVYLRATRNSCESDGYQIASVQAVRGGAAAARGRPAQPEQRVPLGSTVNGTVMRVDLDQPLPPRGTVRIAIDYAYTVAERGSDRNGRQQYGEDWLYTIAQWYPRLAVYDDVRGWNTEQYLGGGEFYLEYGDFDVAITVPRRYVVLATGTLQNRAEVLTAEQLRRLDLALHSDTTIHIVAKEEAAAASARPAGDGPLTWRFRAQNVRDVAWAAAPGFVWDANGWNGILMQGFYSPTVELAWRRAADIARHTISTNAQQWFAYPYPTAIAVAGPESGMEYPQIVFCAAQDSPDWVFGCLDHEFGHQWFPMLVGSNERRYAWMDEGFNTFLNIFTGRAWEHQGRPAPPRDQPAGIANWMRTGNDQPLMLPPDRLGALIGVAGYFKPGAGLYILRHGILEDSTRFDFAFREYIRRWAFRHPTPADFFRTMEDALGEDLSWFWSGWFYRTDRVDLAVDTVVTRAERGVAITRIVLSSPGTLPMPTDIRVQYDDGSSERLRLPVEIWYMGNRYIWVRSFPKPVAAVELDPDMWIPDINRANNVWPRRAPSPAP